jgi:two-component system LytT family response regulator
VPNTPRTTPSRPVPDIRVLVVDDEPLARRALRQLIAPHADLTVVGECRDGREALRALSALTPDLVFLDVQMPEIGGFDVVREWGVERMPPIVFVTAYDEFAVRAFEVQAVDYLLKPITADRFDAAVARVRRRMREAVDVEWSRRLVALVATHPDGAAAGSLTPPASAAARLVVRVGNREIIVPVTDVDYVTADDVYSVLHVGAKQHLLREPLSALEQRLDPRQFVRLHRSALVNMSRVRELRQLENGEKAVVLASGAMLPVSRRRREEVERALLGVPG